MSDGDGGGGGGGGRGGAGDGRGGYRAGEGEVGVGVCVWRVCGEMVVMCGTVYRTYGGGGGGPGGTGCTGRDGTGRGWYGTGMVARECVSRLGRGGGVGRTAVGGGRDPAGRGGGCGGAGVSEQRVRGERRSEGCVCVCMCVYGAGCRYDVVQQYGRDIT